MAMADLFTEEIVPEDGGDGVGKLVSVHNDHHRVAQGVDAEVHVTHGEEAVNDKSKLLLGHHLVALGVPPLDLFQRQVLEPCLQAVSVLGVLKH